MNNNIRTVIQKEKFIERIYSQIFRAKNHEEEWRDWHRRTKEQILLIEQGKALPKEIAEPEEKRYYKLLHDSIQQLLPPNSASSIDGMLEVGSGSGTLSLLLSQSLGCKSTLIDNSEVAIQYASLVNDQAEMVLGDAMEMPFEDNTFDFVHSVGLIEHFDDVKIDRIIGESRRVLKNGGYFYLAVPNYFSPDLISLWSQYGKGTERYISPNALSQYVHRKGFDVISKGYFQYTSGLFNRLNLLRAEMIVGKAGLGFLNYAFCRK